MRKARLLLLASATAVAACGGATPGEQTGCEASCRLLLECTFNTPGKIPECTDACVKDLANKTQSCRDTSAAWGECARGKSCADLKGGACKAELGTSTTACSAKPNDGSSAADGRSA